MNVRPVCGEIAQKEYIYSNQRETITLSMLCMVMYGYQVPIFSH